MGGRRRQCFWIFFFNFSCSDLDKMNNSGQEFGLYCNLSSPTFLPSSNQKFQSTVLQTNRKFTTSYLTLLNDTITPWRSPQSNQPIPWSHKNEMSICIEKQVTTTKNVKSTRDAKWASEHMSTAYLIGNYDHNRLTIISLAIRMRPLPYIPIRSCRQWFLFTSSHGNFMSSCID